MGVGTPGADRGEGAISTLREARKQETRRRVLMAASELFDDAGYEAVTVRAIARRAGVSVGGVFTVFASKNHILSEVMQGRLADLYADLDRVAPHLRGSTADRCRSLFAFLYAFEFRRLRFFLAYISAAFDWRIDPELPMMGANPRLRGLVRSCLEGGVERGDVRGDADLDLAVDLLIGAYVWNYRLAAGGDADAGVLTSVLDRQIGVVFDGLAPAG